MTITIVTKKTGHVIAEMLSRPCHPRPRPRPRTQVSRPKPRPPKSGLKRP